MLTAEQIEQCVFWACQQEVSAPKPGNVNSFSGNHEMEVEDFIKSARAIAPIMAQSSLSVGELILQSICATRQLVDCNTNLGIVLLFAPLCKAMHRCQSFEKLPSALEQVLDNLTIDDADKCYQAIRLAEAGGMGEVDNQDINKQPTITLRQAMELAQKRDTIARQYTNNYDAIWCIGLANLTNAINCGETVEWATTFAYLITLSKIPDTLISRKYGQVIAEKVSTSAHSLLKRIKENNKLSDNEIEVRKWDNELKKEKLNPGTTADLTAAMLLVYAFQQKLS
ncbi:MAG: triphosphoribosyl-dephospho-CoA synthase [Methylophaga sp.]|nr:MAG: triphosphoribosyl-dephospho-CoA synthase [Methylophaga sp.]